MAVSRAAIFALAGLGALAILPDSAWAQRFGGRGGFAGARVGVGGVRFGGVARAPVGIGRVGPVTRSAFRYGGAYGYRVGGYGYRRVGAYGYRVGGYGYRSVGGYGYRRYGYGYGLGPALAAGALLGSIAYGYGSPYYYGGYAAYPYGYTYGDYSTACDYGYEDDCGYYPANYVYDYDYGYPGIGWGIGYYGGGYYGRGYYRRGYFRPGFGRPGIGYRPGLRPTPYGGFAGRGAVIRTGYGGGLRAGAIGPGIRAAGFSGGFRPGGFGGGLRAGGFGGGVRAGGLGGGRR